MSCHYWILAAIDCGSPLNDGSTSAASVRRHHIFLEIHSTSGLGIVGSVYVPPTIVNLIS